jgi:uncharacterized protein YbaP (TraB family)
MISNFHILIYAVSAFICGSAYSQTNTPSFPSIWAWKISTTNKTVYLLGELHSFLDIKGLQVDHQLGKKIYELSEYLWTEIPQKNIDITNMIPLPRIVKPAIMREIQTAIEDDIDSTVQKSKLEKEAIFSRFISEFNRNDPITAFANLEAISLMKLQRKKGHLVSYNGLIIELLNLEIKKPPHEKKLRPLETDTALSESWWSQCSDAKYADDLLTIGLSKLQKDYKFQNGMGYKIQEAFVSSDSSLKKVEETYQKFNEWNILEKCSINPRNLNWLPKILRELETDGAPSAFIVGIGHIGGNNGLLELIKKAGYTNIERIYLTR